MVPNQFPSLLLFVDNLTRFFETWVKNLQMMYRSVSCVIEFLHGWSKFRMWNFKFGHPNLLIFEIDGMMGLRSSQKWHSEFWNLKIRHWFLGPITPSISKISKFGCPNMKFHNRNFDHPCRNYCDNYLKFFNILQIQQRIVSAIVSAEMR